MIELIEKFEGLRLKAYDDGLGVWTIGYGTTRYPDGTPVKQGDEITAEQAKALLTDYCMREVFPIIERIPSLSLNQKRAVASLIYNQGGSFVKSKLYQALIDKDYGEVFHQWDFGVKNWKSHKGLLKRRAEELKTFMGDL